MDNVVEVFHIIVSPLSEKPHHSLTMIPPDNSNSIADKLLYIYTHEQESLEIGKRGIDVVNAYFDITKNGKKFLDFIIQVCKS